VRNSGLRPGDTPPREPAAGRGARGREARPLAGALTGSVAGALRETAEVAITFDDNRLASLVFGQFDQNVAHLERRLGIVATALGNHVVVKGSPDATERARLVLEGLYARARQGGQPLSVGDVDGMIQEAARQGNLFSADEAPADGEPAQFDQIATRRRGAVRARNAAQDAYIRALRAHELVFAEGPAGTGKTWLAVGYAVSLLEQGHAERLILSRPAVEAGERLGFLPGDMREKVDPYLRPIYDALYDFMEARHVDRGLQTGMIEIAPLAFMRGRTLTNAVVLLDEAQNTTSMQMKMFLTRLGENSRMIVTGDPSQIDLPAGQKSGLVEAVRILDGVEGVGRITFRDVDVVRHDLVRRIVGAYEADARAAIEAGHAPQDRPGPPSRRGPLP
jgi:phosphate starvation-inducible PhoH-like protein